MKQVSVNLGKPDVDGEEEQLYY